MSTEMDLQAFDEELIEEYPELVKVIEALRNEIIDQESRIDELEKQLDRYKILRDVVVSQTDLDEDTLDQLIEQRRREEKDE